MVSDSTTAAAINGSIDSVAEIAAPNKLAAFLPDSGLLCGNEGNVAINDTILGNYSGFATVTGTLQGTNSTGAQSVIITFYDYSDYGLLYIGGQISFTSHATVMNSTTSSSFNFEGSVKFNGAFVGTNDFSMVNNYAFNAGKRIEIVTYFNKSSIFSNGKTWNSSTSGSFSDTI